VRSTQDVLKYFKVSEAQGLSEGQVSNLRSEYGRNALPEDPPTPLWELILEQFKDQLVLVSKFRIE
jgi:P-type Ca2+ transporter type 2A